MSDFGPDWPQELIDEYTKKLSDSINEEIYEEVFGEIYVIPLDEAKRDARRKKYCDDIRLAEEEQYLKWRIP